jgi:hypothetical protein
MKAGMSRRSTKATAAVQLTPPELCAVARFLALSLAIASLARTAAPLLGLPPPLIVSAVDDALSWMTAASSSLTPSPDLCLRPSRFEVLNCGKDLWMIDGTRTMNFSGQVGLAILIMLLLRFEIVGREFDLVILFLHVVLGPVVII